MATTASPDTLPLFNWANVSAHSSTKVRSEAIIRADIRTRMDRNFLEFNLKQADAALRRAEVDHYEAQTKGSACPARIRKLASIRLAAARTAFANAEKALDQSN